jgi:hypothetical protein
LVPVPISKNQTGIGFNFGSGFGTGIFEYFIDAKKISGTKGYPEVNHQLITSSRLRYRKLGLIRELELEPEFSFSFFFQELNPEPDPGFHLSVELE